MAGMLENISYLSVVDMAQRYWCGNCDKVVLQKLKPHKPVMYPICNMEMSKRRKTRVNEPKDLNTHKRLYNW